MTVRPDGVNNFICCLRKFPTPWGSRVEGYFSFDANRASSGGEIVRIPPTVLVTDVNQALPITYAICVRYSPGPRRPGVVNAPARQAHLEPVC